MTNPLRFKGEYFFTKEELTEKLKEDLEENGGENLPEADNIELYELYCQNLFERFGLPNDENKDSNEVLADISVLFEIGKVLRLNVSEYIGIESIEIPLLSGEIKRTSISTFSFISPALKKDFVNICDVESLKCPLSFEYKTLKTANQIVNPTLSFIENNKEVTVYKSSKEINLLNRQEDVIIFNIPIKDIFIHSSGFILLSCNGSELCKISIPTIKLPLGKNGVQSFEQFLSYINNELSGKPNDDLIFLYEFTKNRILELWLNDRGINIKKQLELWEANKHEMTINDLNQVLILLGATKKLSFRMRDYFLINTIFTSEDYLNESNICNNSTCFIRWKSSSPVNISFKLEPLANLNVNFNLNIKIGDKFLSRPLIFNLQLISKENNICSYIFDSNEVSNNDIGRYPIKVVNCENDNDVDIETHCSIIVTGKKFPIKLSDDETITMIGIYDESNTHSSMPFYIAQTPITQNQLELLLKISNVPELKDALERSKKEYGDMGNYPATFLSYELCLKIITILNSLNKHTYFCVPSRENFVAALRDGPHYLKYVINDSFQEKNELQHVGSNPTKLGVCDLLGNSLLHTSDTDGLFSNTKYLFGKPCRKNDNYYLSIYIHTVSYKKSKFDNFESIAGFCPIMFLTEADTDDEDDYWDCQSLDNATDLSDFLMKLP